MKRLTTIIIGFLAVLAVAAQTAWAEENPFTSRAFWAEMKQTENWQEIVQSHIDQGWDVNEFGSYDPQSPSLNFPPLTLAIRYGPLDAVPFLIELGADVNLGPKSKIVSNPSCVGAVFSGGPPLNTVAVLGGIDTPNEEQAAIVATIHHLLAAGADINATDVNGNTPLHDAFGSGTVGAINALLEAGADQTLWNAQGNTPYDLMFKRRDDHKLVSFFHLRNFYKFSNTLKKVRGTDWNGCRAVEEKRGTAINGQQKQEED